MKIVYINANTEHCAANFIRSLRMLIEDIEKGKIDIGIIGAVDKNNEYRMAEFSSAPGPIVFRLVGLLEFLKHKLLGVI